MSTQSISSIGRTPTIELEHIGGDLAVEGWDREDLEARGDDLHEIQRDGSAVSMFCCGDLQISVPRGSGLVVTFVGGDMKLHDLEGAVTISFVGGDASLKDLNGAVSVAGVMGDLQMQNVNNASVGAARGGPGPDFSEQISRRVEEATRRAQRQAERTARRAEQKVRQVEGKLLHGEPRGRSWKMKWDLGRGPAQPPGEPVTDEERMVILKMLQDKKITAEEAEKLLSVLEGGG